MKPVALVFANLKGNIGDFAILEAMLLAAAARHPESPLWVVPHGFLSTDELRLAAFRDACSVPFELRGVTPYRNIGGFADPLTTLGIWPVMQRKQVERVAASAQELADDLSECEAIYTAGGDQWSGFRLGASMFGTVAAVAKTGVPIRTFPFSVNPRFARHHLAQDIRRYFGFFDAPILVRDSVSQQALAKAGVSATLVPDCVFGLHEAALEVPPMPYRNPERVLIAITARQSKLPGVLRALETQLKGANFDWEFLTTCWTEDLAQMQATGRMVRAPLTWQEAVAEFKSSRLLVTNRLHGLILGTLAGAALLPVCDRSKAKAFALDAKLTWQCYGVEVVLPPTIRMNFKMREQVLSELSAFLAANVAYSPTPSNADDKIV